MPGADRRTQKNQAVVVVDEPACPAACRRRGALPEVAPSVSINNGGTLSSLRRAGELSWQRSCNASAYEDPYVDRSHAITATYRGGRVAFLGRCVGAMGVAQLAFGQRRDDVAFRVQGCEARRRRGGSQTKGVAVVVASGTPGKRPSRAEFHPFGESRRSGDAASSRCSKQATANNASVTS